tara:strand:+ start:12633 stop:13313 length:681 start_codon:yes stop_codon:yes gene_type:complete
MKLFLALCVALISCGVAAANESATSVESDEIQPRSLGSTWEYSSYYFEGDTMVSGGTAQERVVGVQELDGVKIYRVELVTDWRTLFERLSGASLDADAYSYFWEYNSAEGSHHFSENEQGATPPGSLEHFSLTLPYPVEVGFKYHADESEYEVIAVDRKIEVAAGQFEVVVYQFETQYSDAPEDSDRQRLFMGPGVGLVRWEMDVKDENGKWVLDCRDDLFSYEIK